MRLPMAGCGSSTDAANFAHGEVHEWRVCAIGSVEFTVLSEELRVLRLTQERVRADFSSLLKLLFFTERDDDHEGRFALLPRGQRTQPDRAGVRPARLAINRL